VKRLAHSEHGGDAVEPIRSLADEKFAMVIGSSRSEEAKIGEITPALLSLSGRCEESPWNMRLPI